MPQAERTAPAEEHHGRLLVARSRGAAKISLQVTSVSRSTTDANWPSSSLRRLARPALAGAGLLVVGASAAPLSSCRIWRGSAPGQKRDDRRRPAGRRSRGSAPRPSRIPRRSSTLQLPSRPDQRMEPHPAVVVPTPKAAIDVHGVCVLCGEQSASAHVERLQLDRHVRRQRRQHPGAAAEQARHQLVARDVVVELEHGRVRQPGAERRPTAVPSSFSA